MKPVSRIVFFWMILFAASAQGAAIAPQKPVKPSDRLVPHKALYEIKLTGTKSGSQIINIKGQMLYEWQPTCDAWISNHRFNISYEYADAPASSVRSDFSTYETFDGKSLDFTSQRKRDGEADEVVRGHARLDDQGAGKIVYSLPEDLSFDLPAGSKFPAMHTLAVVEGAALGKNVLNATVFDGGDEEGPVEVNAVIGKKAAALPDYLAKQKNIDMKLLQSPAHRVRLAFFPLKGDSESSDYEMSVLLHDNGIISDMSIDYDDFSVSQRLIALESLKSQCAE